MALILINFVLRLLFLCAVPLVGFLADVVESDALVLGLSVVACVAEVALLFHSSCGGRSSRGGRRARHSIRPPQFFLLQVVLLYSVQMWILVLRLHGTHGLDQGEHVPALRPRPANAPLERLAGEGFKAANEASAPLVRLAGEGSKVENEVSAVQPSIAVQAPAVDSVNAAAGTGEPIARYVEGQPFDLDAPLEKLRWKPKTISVVLPCAEEREYAFKTVQSFFQNTPDEVLHEIVVVDDGSNPPLSETHLGADVQSKYKVKICRHDSTIGLIGAKKTGGDAASGDIVAFFDCHVAPQTNWHQDFLRLIGENYRRMVVPQITTLNVDTWTQVGGGGGMSKCYVTWDGDFKWGGPDDMYMGMLSGGLAGMSKRWWNESGGYDDKMLGWGGENIDQGVRMWVCGGEIVAAPNAQVAHMWRTGGKTAAHYKHVGDTMRNRARAVNAWFGEFAQKLDQFPEYSHRKQGEGDGWIGDMSTFQRVRDRLGGCRPFAWYLRRFKSVYEDGGLIPPDIFMIREEQSGKCLLFGGQAGTSGGGRELVKLKDCDPANDRFFWHLGNVDRKTGRCCSGLRAWNTEQCFQGGDRGGSASTGICEVSGHSDIQHWRLTAGGQLRHKDRCMGLGTQPGTLKEAPCVSFRSGGGARFKKAGAKVPIETELYRSAQRDHPETFALVNQQLEEMGKKSSLGPRACKTAPASCLAMFFGDGSRRCLDESGSLTSDVSSCEPLLLDGQHVKRAENGDCLDSWSDNDPETFGFYACHDGENQKFNSPGASRVCTAAPPGSCFATQPWPVAA